MQAHQTVTDMIASYLALADAEAPGLIEGLYLEGSAALGDFQPQASDIDFVAVTAEPPDSAALGALQRVHDRLRDQHRRPFLDGVYLTWSDLAAGPTAAAGRPASHEGRFNPQARADRFSPITWHTIARHGVTLRGPEPADTDIWTDPAGLAAWCNTNLDQYWACGLARAGRLLSKPGIGLLTGYGTVWTVTGISRLHYTIATGEITSKSGASQHALHTFDDRWQPLINEALRLRRNDPQPSRYRNPFARRPDIIDFGHAVIADAHTIYRGQLNETD